jgi:hypothetical protein
MLCLGPVLTAAALVTGFAPRSALWPGIPTLRAAPPPGLCDACQLFWIDPLQTALPLRATDAWISHSWTGHRGRSTIPRMITKNKWGFEPGSISPEVAVESEGSPIPAHKRAPERVVQHPTPSGRVLIAYTGLLPCLTSILHSGLTRPPPCIHVIPSPPAHK